VYRGGRFEQPAAESFEHEGVFVAETVTNISGGEAVTDAICERYRKLYGGLVYDVLEHFGYPN